MDYLPEINTLPALLLYSFIGYIISTLVAYLLTPKKYDIEDYRETIRRNRERNK